MDKRNTIRVPFHVRAVVKYTDKILEGEVVNLSTGGMLFKTAEQIPIDHIVDISVYLYGSSSHLALNITGKVVRKGDDGTAIKFTELDLDSFIHLRNIVSRNAFDEDKIVKDFQEFNIDDTITD